MRVFCASLATETNTFSPLRTDLTDFEESFYARPGEHPVTPTLCSAVFTEARKRARTDGFTLVEGTAAWAEPGGLVKNSAWIKLRDEVLGQLRDALPVDAVLLGLHGAMIVDRCLDPEGELIRMAREIAGQDAKIGVTFDPHSHLSAQRVENADIITVFKEFPHTDFERAATDCVDLTLKALHGEIRPDIAVFDVRMIDVLPTSQQPMRGFVDRMLDLEAAGEALSISLIHGFMAGDSPDLGAKMIVITDDDPKRGAALAKELGLEVFSFRGQGNEKYLGAEEAIEQALSEPKGPVVIADVWDNPGGGVAGDGTILTRLILERDLQNVAIGTIWDPMAVRLCQAAGEGAELDLRFGGKTSASAGDPIDARVKVLCTRKNAQQSFGASVVPLGDSVTIQIGGVELVLNSNRSQSFSPNLFEGMGIDPKKKRILVVKSTNHFFGAFAPISSRIIYASIDGPYPNKPEVNCYERLTRPIWPIVNEPFLEGTN